MHFANGRFFFIVSLVTSRKGSLVPPWESLRGSRGGDESRRRSSDGLGVKQRVILASLPRPRHDLLNILSFFLVLPRFGALALVLFFSFIIQSDRVKLYIFTNGLVSVFVVVFFLLMR